MGDSSMGVLIVDDHALMAESLADTVDLEPRRPVVGGLGTRCASSRSAMASGSRCSSVANGMNSGKSVASLTSRATCGFHNSTVAYQLPS